MFFFGKFLLLAPQAVAASFIQFQMLRLIDFGIKEPVRVSGYTLYIISWTISPVPRIMQWIETGTTLKGRNLKCMR